MKSDSSVVTLTRHELYERVWSPNRRGSPGRNIDTRHFAVPKNNDRVVYLRADGLWVHKRVTGVNASSSHVTQTEALKEANRMVAKEGGSEVATLGPDGEVSSCRCAGDSTWLDRMDISFKPILDDVAHSLDLAV